MCSVRREAVQKGHGTVYMLLFRRYGKERPIIIYIKAHRMYILDRVSLDIHQTGERTRAWNPYAGKDQSG